MDVLFTGQGLLTIAVIALLLFGPDKLPEIARVVGKFMAEFKRVQQSMEATIQAEVYQSKTGAADVGTIPTAAAAPQPSTSVADDDDEEEEE